VREALRQAPGVQSADVSLERRQAMVETESSQVDRDQLVEAIRKAGYEVPDQSAPKVSHPTDGLLKFGGLSTARVVPKTPTIEPQVSLEHLLLDVDGMHCASCISRVEQALTGVPGVKSARANLATNQAAAEFDRGRVEIADLLRA